MELKELQARLRAVERAIKQAQDQEAITEKELEGIRTQKSVLIGSRQTYLEWIDDETRNPSGVQGEGAGGGQPASPTGTVQPERTDGEKVASQGEGGSGDTGGGEAPSGAD